MKTIAYIAHPVAGDVEGNRRRIAEIVRKINLEEPDVIPFVPYFVDLYAMNDNNPVERTRGQNNALEVLRCANEIRLYGDRISEGMLAEIKAVWNLPIIIRPMTPETEQAYREFLLKRYKGPEKRKP